MATLLPRCSQKKLLFDQSFTQEDNFHLYVRFYIYSITHTFKFCNMLIQINGVFTAYYLFLKMFFVVFITSVIDFNSSAVQSLKISLIIFVEI